MSEIRFGIWDPTGNVTALVESEVMRERQPEVAARIMERYAEVEQVGYVRFGEHPSLRMAGGEFCGNASMSAAALVAHRSGAREHTDLDVDLSVSGADGMVGVRLRKQAPGAYAAEIAMPPIRRVEEVTLTAGGLRGRCSLMRMQGISHMVIEETHPFFALLETRELAERTVRSWCGEVGADGLGLMFVEGSGNRRTLTPLVYVPGSDTVFWEHSCASGSYAVGCWLASETNQECVASLQEPGGVLRVQCSPDGVGKLQGSTRLVVEATLRMA